MNETKRRIFILSTTRFPRGDAGANYVEYMALALQSQGWQVIVTGFGQCREQDRCGDTYIYKGIEYFCNKRPVSGRWLMLNGARRFWKEVCDKYDVTHDDYCIVYSQTFMVYLTIALEQRIDNKKTFYTRVEDYQPYQFKGGPLALRYLSTLLAKKQARKWFCGVFPISTTIAHQESVHGNRHLVVPIMANPFEYEYREREREQTLRLIYPGMKANNLEDNVGAMIRAVVMARQEYGVDVELHITGIKRQRFEQWIEREKLSLQDAYSVVILHDWLEYVDLVRLYQSSDYLLLMRKVNGITRANFPSKVPELLCYGVVPICTDVGDYTKYYLKNEETCFLIDGDDATACCQAILQAAKASPEKYANMRRNARRLVETKFYYKNWGERLNQFLLEQQ